MRSFKEVSQDLQESVDELARNELDETNWREYEHKIANYRNSII
jgi:hypothetical protein